MKRPSGFTPPPDDGRAAARRSGDRDAASGAGATSGAGSVPEAGGIAGAGKNADSSKNAGVSKNADARSHAGVTEKTGAGTKNGAGKKTGADKNAGAGSKTGAGKNAGTGESTEPRASAGAGKTSDLRAPSSAGRASGADADSSPSGAAAFLPSVRQARRERKRVERAEVKRFTARSRRRRRNGFIAGGAVVGVAALAALLAFSPILSVRTIEVDGAVRVSSDQVVRGLQPIMGSPFPLVDQSEIKAELVKYPLIESYSIESRPPDTLVVKLVERTPVGVVDTGEGFTVVDAAGVVIEASAQRPSGYPLIEVEGGVSSEGFRSAAAVLRAMPDDLRMKVESVTAKTHDDVTLALRDTDATVLWGSADDAGFKTLALERLMAATDPSTVAQYDVSSRKTVVVRQSP